MVGTRWDDMLEGLSIYVGIYVTDSCNRIMWLFLFSNTRWLSLTCYLARYLNENSLSGTLPGSIWNSNSLTTVYVQLSCYRQMWAIRCGLPCYHRVHEFPILRAFVPEFSATTNSKARFVGQEASARLSNCTCTCRMWNTQRVFNVGGKWRNSD